VTFVERARFAGHVDACITQHDCASLCLAVFQVDGDLRNCVITSATLVDATQQPAPLATNMDLSQISGVTVQVDFRTQHQCTGADSGDDGDDGDDGGDDSCDDGSCDGGGDDSCDDGSCGDTDTGTGTGDGDGDGDGGDGGGDARKPITPTSHAVHATAPERAQPYLR
jgi:hypothetical protein